MSNVSEADVRAEVREWLAANWNPDLSLVEWRGKLADSGWGMPQWPKEWYGRGLPHALARAVEEEFANVGAVGVAKSGVRLLAAATLLEHGSDLQKKKFLRRILTGEDTWCQFFSEPGSGSDLAGATTRADLNGDYWIVNGQKVAMTTLAHERRGADGLTPPSKRGSRVGRIHAEERAETEKANQPYKWYPQRAGRVDLVIDRAKETGANKDPHARQEIAKLMILAKSAEWTARRARAAQQQGRPQGPEGSLGKLAASHVARACSRLHTLMTGTDAMLTGHESPREGIIAEILVSVPAVSIAGGTDEIQRNIIAERVLDLPKEPRFDTGPFRNVRKN